MKSLEANKRIAKNTVYLYIRTFFLIVIMLYASRTLLDALGVDDLGIYNVVAGVVALMSFFQAAQAKASSRFITYELGKKGDESNPPFVFSLCFTIHVVMAIVVFLLAETVGLWIVNNLTNIPETRSYSANIVFQFAIITFCIQLIRVPFDAVVIAYEEMSAYAYLSIIEGIFQLISCLILLYMPSDRLIAYSLFMAISAICVFTLFAIYIRINHVEYKFSLKWNQKRSIEILSFSGWSLLGGSANSISQQGVSLLFNNFVGLIANAALGFANQVNSALVKFVANFSTAFTPQIIKLYAEDDRSSLVLLLKRASKFSFVLAYLMGLPLLASMDFVLKLWLHNVPEYTVDFCALIVVCSIIDATTGVYNTVITASGDIKKYQICITLSYLADFICSFILLLLGYSPTLVFGSRILTRGILNMLIGLCFLKEKIGFDIIGYAREVISPIFVVVIITTAEVFAIELVMTGWVRLLFGSAILVVTVILLSTFLIFSNHERNIVFNMIKTKIGHGKR